MDRCENEEKPFSWFPYTEGELFNENDYYIAYVSGTTAGKVLPIPIRMPYRE